ncbi:hypothetical protein BN1195_00634 [Chryseobacterium oranimense G311]|uniref:hypothetical protein n=1 Tax=Chryseobacterium oranimense TaxID=421058 RepID=UPI000533946A|nr:hypothetical protein [Chryseobacterium oranimense]CEJ68351.1 hypothetical protein BN1195_00634 [Chryseobacterium oranimense G311]
MKYTLAIISFLFYSLYFGQNDLEIKILNDTIKKVSYFDQNNIVYTITNASEKNYLLILDDTGFSEDPEYSVEPFFIGLPDYHLYEKNVLLTPMFSFGAGSTNSHSQLDLNSKEFQKFRKQFLKEYDEYEMKIAYRISKNIIILKPKEKKIFSTKVNFPNYMGRYFNMANSKDYYFQISLQNPHEFISKYYKVLQNKDKQRDFTIFTGQIFSNKIPLVYEVYNNP